MTRTKDPKDLVYCFVDNGRFENKCLLYENLKGKKKGKLIYESTMFVHIY